MIGYFILKLFMWTMFGYGLTQIIVESALFSGIRGWIAARSVFLMKLTSCMLCSGTWISALLTMLWSPSEVVFTHEVIIFRSALFIIMNGVIGGAFIWYLHLIDNKLSK